MINIKDDPYFTAWIDSVKPITGKSYALGLAQFCEFVGKTPSELVKEAYEDYNNCLPPYELRHIKDLDLFQIHLRNSEKYSNHTKLSRINGVKRFYKAHKISTADVNDHHIPGIVSERYLELPVLKREDVRKMVKYFERNKLMRAVILTAFSSGQAQDDIFSLKGRHIKDLVNGVAIIKRIRGKTNKNPYLFFIPPEALEAIHEYKPHIKDDEYIFTIGNGDKMYAAYAGQYMLRMGSDLGWPQGYAGLHRVRHYWETKLTGRMDATFLEFILGHTVSGVKSSYFVGEKVQKEILAAYLENLHLLTVFTDRETLQKENEVLKTKQGGEMEEMKKNYEMLQEQMTVMNEFLEKFGPEGLKVIEERG